MSVSPSTNTQSMNQTMTPASISRPIHVIGARLLINSVSGNLDLREYCIGGGWGLGLRGCGVGVRGRLRPPPIPYPPAPILNSLQFRTSDRARQSPRGAYPRRIFGAP